MLGQFDSGKRPSDAVVADVGGQAPTVEQAERLQDAGIKTDPDIDAPALDFLKGLTGRNGALGHDSRRRQRAS